VITAPTAAAVTTFGKYTAIAAAKCVAKGARTVSPETAVYARLTPARLAVNTLPTAGDPPNVIVYDALTGEPLRAVSWVNSAAETTRG
jgi:hypothetical protein